MRRIPVIAVLLLVLPFFSAFGSGRPIAEPALAVRAGGALQDVAFAGGRFLTIWSESTGGLGSGLRAALSSAEGRRLSSESIVLPIDTTRASVVGMGDSFALFWADSDGKQHYSQFDRDAQLINDRVLGIPPARRFGSVAWNGTMFLAQIYSSPGTVEVHAPLLLDRNGDVVTSAQALPFRSLVAAGSHFLAVRDDRIHRDLHVYAFDRDGNATGRTIDPMPAESVLFAEGSDSPSTLAVWWSSGEVRIAIVGGPSPPAVRVLTGPRNSPGPMAVARVGNEYVVVTRSIDASGSRRLWSVWRISLDGHPTGEPVDFEMPPAIYNWKFAASSDTLLIPFIDSSERQTRLHHLAIGPQQTRLFRQAATTRAIQSQPELTEGAGRVLATWTELQDPPVVRTAIVTQDASTPGTTLNGRASGCGIL